jgi:hypothetical protein
MMQTLLPGYAAAAPGGMFGGALPAGAPPTAGAGGKGAALRPGR